MVLGMLFVDVKQKQKQPVLKKKFLLDIYFFSVGVENITSPMNKQQANLKRFLLSPLPRQMELDFQVLSKLSTL